MQVVLFIFKYKIKYIFLEVAIFYISYKRNRFKFPNSTNICGKLVLYVRKL